MKGLIPAAGKGKRLEPITLAIPKELLMIGDKAVIEYVIDAMRVVGITDITIVVGWRKNALLDYLGSGQRLGVRLTYVVQDKTDGLGKAVLTGERIVGKEPFFVVLGDDFFYPTTFLQDILAFHTETNADATIGVAEVTDPTRHGIIKPGKDQRVVDIVEKPAASQAPSRLGCCGIYIFTHPIFDALKKIQPGVNNEYQLTDAIKILVDEGYKVYYKKIEGNHIDVGTLDDLRKANAFLFSHKKP